MISIVTAYYNRKKLFKRTLDSLQENVGKIEFEVIVVDDGSDVDERLEDLQEHYPFLKVFRIEPQDKWYSNSCIPFNFGFEKALGDKIIIQNPECYHLDNILEYVEKNLKENTYLSFGCFSLDKENTDNDVLFFNKTNIEEIIKISNKKIQIDGALGWYNHSEYRPEAFHFCTAITTKDLVDLGGFDPRFALGYGYDDNELIYRIKLKKMNICFVDYKIVLHQNHYIKELDEKEQQQKLQNPKAIRNRILLELITYNSFNYKANYLKIKDIEPKIEDRKKYKKRKTIFKILSKLKIV